MQGRHSSVAVWHSCNVPKLVEVLDSFRYTGALVVLHTILFATGMCRIIISRLSIDSKSNQRYI